MSTWISLRPPTDDRSISGTFEVIIRDRSADRIVFEVTALHFRSLEDDLYDVTTSSGGTITVERASPFIQASVALSVNGAEEKQFRGAISGDCLTLLLDEDPPVFAEVGLLNFTRGPADRGRVNYSMIFYATIDGSPVPTCAPVN